MSAEDPAQPAAPPVVTAAPEQAPEIKEKPVEGTPQPTELDPTHESGYGFGV